MTAQQYFHHNEQMEAARREFNEFWQTVAYPKMVHDERRVEVVIQDLCWHTFKHAKGLA